MKYLRFIVFDLVLIVCMVLIVNNIKFVNIHGNSMNNTLSDGGFVLSIKTQDLKRGDIVVFDKNTEEDSHIIKRIIALDNERIEISDKEVRINGNILKEEYIKEPMNNPNSITKSIPDGKLFVMGDNRNRSLDSRFEEVGLVDKGEVIGKVVLDLGKFGINQYNYTIYIMVIILVVCILFKRVIKVKGE